MMTVITTGEAREQLSQIAASFDAGETEPVIFGSHRRAQAVILPVSVWERLVTEAENDIDIELAKKRLAKKNPRLSHAEVLAMLNQSHKP